jgi:hypothetical protein
VTRLLTASRLRLIEVCPAAWALPHVEDSRPDPERDAGRADHEAYHAQLEGRTPLSQPLAELLHALGDGRKLVSVVAERAFAWNPRTGRGRELAEGKHRDYVGRGAKPGEICGTPDAVLVFEGGHTVIVDWKRHPAEGPEARGNLQLGFAALALGLDECGVALVFLGTSPATIDRHHMDEIEIAAMAARLRKISRDAGTGSLHEGPWCRYCPAWDFCPAKGLMIGALARTIAEAHGMNSAALTDEERAGLTLQMLQQAREVDDRLRPRLRELAERKGIELPDGRCVPRGSKQLRVVNGRGA